MKNNQNYRLNKKIASDIGRAIADYTMIRECDRIAVCSSGGKDGNLLLYALARLRDRSPIDFSLYALTIDPTGENYDLSPVTKYAESLGIKHHIVRYPIFKILEESAEKSSCSLCANIRRGILASAARDIGADTLALGHHRDDVIETAFMNLIYAGRFDSFAPNMYMSRSGLRVIRPLVYVAEENIRSEVKKLGLPTLDFNCKYSYTSMRAGIKSTIRDIADNAPQLAGNVMHALAEGCAAWSKDRAIRKEEDNGIN